MKKRIHMIGNAHLDPIWLWRWQEGCNEVLQTFRSAIDRLKEYKDLIFTCSSSSYYQWVEEIDPELFKEIQEMVRKGRWVIVNGWNVQPDCNIPSGESFARQSLYSQLYYYKKFGRICNTGYNVDSFGHNGNMPQLLNLGGMRTYVMMRPGPHENPDVPEDLFWWEGPDGSRVLTFHIRDSYGFSGTKDIDYAIKKADEAIASHDHDTMVFYGIGNHGGGPTKGDINHIRELASANPENEIVFSSTDDFFTEVCNLPMDIPTWKDDLQHHASGCYSATSLVKQLNRRAENALSRSEKWDTVASLLTKAPASTEKYQKAWNDVCFNQFHDILCGCSIMEAYEDVKNSTGEALIIADRTETSAILRIISDIDTWKDGIDEEATLVRHHFHKDNYPRPVIVFNPHSYEITVPVQTYHPSSAVRNSSGEEVVFQNVRSSRSNDSHLDTVFMATLPPFGYETFWLSWIEGGIDYNEMLSVKPDAVYNTDIKVNGLTVENEFLRVTFDKYTGAISSLVSKEDGFDYAKKGNLAAPVVIDDHDTDTWAHNHFKFHNVKGNMTLMSIKLAEYGPLRAVIRTKHRFNDSYLTQDFILSSGQKSIEVRCKAMWQEPFTMLKTSFPMNGTDAVSTYEIPSAFIKRPVNGEEEPAQNWADITLTSEDGVRRGLSVMTDSKYSYDCPDNTLRATLIRNVIFADHYSDRPDAEFNFTDEGIQRFTYGIYVHSGEAENSDVVREAAVLNCAPIAVPAGYRKGSQPQKKSFISVSKDNINVTAFKFCEDGSGDVIIRAYETAGKDTPRVNFICDLIDAGFRADFRKNEIKTFRVNKDGFVRETNFLEGIIPPNERDD